MGRQTHSFIGDLVHRRFRYNPDRISTRTVGRVQCGGGKLIHFDIYSYVDAGSPHRGLVIAELHRQINIRGYLFGG